jgi:peptidoglycan/xylan/chitin deacetylase (PgdA/CDA1 family)
MYHSISDEPEPGVAAYYQTNTSPASFRRQMQYLADNGYQTLTLTQALAVLRPASSGRNPNPLDSLSANGLTGSVGGEGRGEVASDLRPLTSDLCPPAHSRLATHDSPRNHSPFAIRHSPSQLVVLTFDDGFLDFYTEAFPVLRGFGFTATMFLPTGFISDSLHSPFAIPNSPPFALRFPSSGDSPLTSGGQSSLPSLTSVNSSCPSHNPNPSSFPNSPLNHSPFATLHSPPTQFLSWDQVRELRRAGIEFGSHSVNHPKLVDLRWDQVEFELRQSKLELEEQLSEPIDAFCYPYAFPSGNHSFVAEFRELLNRTGYTSCATTDLGRVQADADPFQLKRLPINDCDDNALLKAKLDGAYDWLAYPQRMVKRLKRAIRAVGASTVAPPEGALAATSARPAAQVQSTIKG